MTCQFKGRRASFDLVIRRIDTWWKLKVLKASDSMGRHENRPLHKSRLNYNGACLLGLVFRDVPTVTTAYAETATAPPIHLTIDGLQGGTLPVGNARDPVHGYRIPLYTQTIAR
jgi:hypothetical protein